MERSIMPFGMPESDKLRPRAIPDEDFQSPRPHPVRVIPAGQTDAAFAWLRA